MLKMMTIEQIDQTVSHFHQFTTSMDTADETMRCSCGVEVADIVEALRHTELMREVMYVSEIEDYMEALRTRERVSERRVRP